MQKVNIGKNKKGEVDFVATKNKDFKYIQVCYKLTSEETKQREFGAHKGITEIITFARDNMTIITILC